MKPRRLLGLGMAVIYVGVIAWAPLLDKLVLFPSTEAIPAGGALRRMIDSPVGEVEVWIARSQQARPVTGPEIYVLRFYGNADRPEHWVAGEAEMFPGRDVEVWGVNYPGFGGSAGPARLARVGPAVLAAYDEVKRVAGSRPIIVSGTSFGTIAALHIGARRSVSGLVLHNPPALREMILRQFGWWNLWLLAGPLSCKVPAALDSVANARATRAPVVFLLSEMDEIVAPRFQALVVEAYGGEKRLIPLRGATHLTPLDQDNLAILRDNFSWLVGMADRATAAK